jgi:hypothetical protein
MERSNRRLMMGKRIEIVDDLAELEVVPIVKVCIWTLDDEDQWGMYWQPGCKDAGIDGTIAEDFDGPLQWGWRFCPYCGVQLIQRRDGDGV